MGGYTLGFEATGAFLRYGDAAAPVMRCKDCAALILETDTDVHADWHATLNEALAVLEGRR
jgi:hypothetical protein